MKIGIITLSASYNCGSMLQSYALKKIMEKFGDVEIINFSSEASHRMYDIVPKPYLGKLKMLIKNGKLFRELCLEKSAYKNFQRTHLHIKGKEFFAKDLPEISSKYDIVVAGSDQIWNVCMYDFDDAFFCWWAESKKIAYAPSLGGHSILEGKEKDKYIKWIKNFDFLSARESFGKECLEEITSTKVTKVLDPTILFGESKWQKLIKKPLVKGNYIFYYSWAYCDEDSREIVAKRSKDSGLPVYVIDAHKWIKHSPESAGFILCKEAGPLAFLNLMYYAKECYVESFHGMLFAYMFKKNFWLLDTHEHYDAMDQRLKELVKLLNIKDRILTKYNDKSTNKNSDLTYDNNAFLSEMKRESFLYVKEAILSCSSHI